LWLVIPIDDNIDKKLKKYKANKPLINNYLGFLEELKLVNDPATLGEIKCGQYKNCRGMHLTKSHSLIYYVDYAKRTVFLIDLDDHKNLYGRD
jgi:mRNA-degrading endonuclease YafQ of YafQ-DinJ toxin-antitoxin module